MKVNISLGELLDKVSILKIKKKKIRDKDKLKEINLELKELKPFLKREHKSYIKMLMKINLSIWNGVDKQWKMENEDNYDFSCVDLARDVLLNNHKRFNIKDEVNRLFNSEIKEVKSVN